MSLFFVCMTSKKRSRCNDGRGLYERWEELARSLEFLLRLPPAQRISPEKAAEQITNLLTKYRHNVIMTELSQVIPGWCATVGCPEIARHINWVEGMFGSGVR